jgi:signal transduction histidine kinase/DNA-binding NarL/FixJ family response regulator
MGDFTSPPAQSPCPKPKSWTMKRSGSKSWYNDDAMDLTNAERILEISRELTSATTLEKLLHRIVAVAAELTDSQSAGILLFNEQRNDLRFTVVTGNETELLDLSVPIETSIAGVAFTSGKPVFVDNVQADARYYSKAEQATGIKAQTLLAVPLQFKEHRIGVLEVENKSQGRTFSEPDLEMLTVLAAQATITIENARLVEVLQKHNEVLEETVLQRTAEVVQQQRNLAVRDERIRMSRELHDGLTQTLGFINLQIQAAQTLLAKGETAIADSNLQRVFQLSQEAQANLRSFILGLRNSSANAENLFTAIDLYVRQFRQDTGLQIDLSLPNHQDSLALTPAVEDQLLHLIQEALTNVRKHAGAQKVEIVLGFDERSLQISISDDGAGFSVNQAESLGRENFGLQMMRERAQLAGGRLEIRSASGRGTQILVFIPRLHKGKPAPALNAWPDLQKLRLLLVDDAPIFLEGLQNLLTARRLTVIGLAHDGLEAQEKVRQLHPDVIVMDLRMPNCDGLDATRAIKSAFPEIKIAILTISDDQEHLFEALKNGASGFLLKDMNANDFCDSLNRIVQGETVLSPTLASRVIAEFSQVSPGLSAGGSRMSDQPLSSQQREVLNLVASGLTYKEAGSILHLSESAIKYHMGQLLDCLHLKTRAQAVAFARRTLK